MKTKALKEFEENISALNDNYSHYILVWEQFSVDYEKIIEANGAKTTVAVFKNNKNTAQYNVLLSHLDTSHTQTEYLILKSIYLLAYGYFEHYLIELHKFGQALDSKILDLQQKLKEEEEEEKEEVNNDKEDKLDRKILEKFFNRIGVDIKTVFSAEELLTLDYIRIRRNRITHRATAPQGAILKIINNSGKQLNEYWDKQLKNGRYSLDFSAKNIDGFGSNELFDLLNIYRKLSTKIDASFIAKIGIRKIEKHILDKFIESNGKDIKGMVAKRKRSKFKMYCITEFGYKIDDFDLENIDIVV